MGKKGTDFARGKLNMKSIDEQPCDDIPVEDKWTGIVIHGCVRIQNVCVSNIKELFFEE